MYEDLDLDPTFISLIDIIEIITDDIARSGENGWYDTANVLELTMAQMMPSTRKKFWDYMSMRRKKMGNKIFEDQQDYTSLVVKEWAKYLSAH